MPLLLDKPEPSREHRARSSRRLWTIPPCPPVWEQFEGYTALNHEPDALALFLFQSYRDVHLWVTTDPAYRSGLFRGDTAFGEPPLPELTDVTSTFRSLATAPAQISPPAVASACALVADWASRSANGDVETAFASLAALVSPDDSDLAFTAGRAARRSGRHSLARDWFRRAVALARRADDPAAGATAYLGWGIMEERLNRRAEARAKFAKAWKAAKRGKLRKLAAAVRHNMIALALDDRDLAGGQSHIVSAYKLYGRDADLGRLANDAAGFWASFGFFNLARPFFEHAVNSADRPPERFAMLANISRAAAALGDRERFLEGCDAILASEHQAGEFLVDILIELAKGAMSLRLKNRALSLLQRAVERCPPHQTSMHDVIQHLVEVARAGEEPEPVRDPSPDIKRFAERFLARLNATR